MQWSNENQVKMRELPLNYHQHQTQPWAVFCVILESLQKGLLKVEKLGVLCDQEFHNENSNPKRNGEIN